MQKDFVLDTNVLIDNPNAIEIIRNGKDGGDVNHIWIPETVLSELDSLKRKDGYRSVIKKIAENIERGIEYINIIYNETGGPLNDPYVYTDVYDKADDNILYSVIGIKEKYGTKAILVTNDKLMTIKAHSLGIEVQDFKESIPFDEEHKLNTGFVDSVEEFEYPNTFCWDSGTLIMKKRGDIKPITYTHQVWKTKPKHYTQNAAFELLLDEDVDLVSMSASAGMGKTHCAVASALHHVLEKKTYDKIYIFKTVEDIGPSIGYLPGPAEEKIEPYVKYIKSMFFKLHKLRKGNNKVFLDEQTLNPEFVEILPLTYIRGMNIDNAFVIIDEAQNISRLNMRSLLTRMGDNVKCVVCGDPDQVDNPNLNTKNNGLNWIIRLFSGEENYGHITLGGNKSRGPICDMVLKNKL